MFDLVLLSLPTLQIGVTPSINESSTDPLKTLLEADVKRRRTKHTGWGRGGDADSGPYMLAESGIVYFNMKMPILFAIIF